MIGQMLEAIWAGFKVGIHTFLSVLSFYQQLSDFKTEIIAAAIGVPAILLLIGGIGLAVIKFLRKHA